MARFSVAADLGSRELSEDLERIAAGAREPIEQLGRLRPAYASADDLASIDSERDRLRAELEEHRRAYELKLEALETVKNSRRSPEFHVALLNSLARSDPSLLAEANRLAPLWKKHKEFRSELRASLEEDQAAYAARKTTLERRRTRRFLAAGLPAAFLLLAAAAVALRRRDHRRVLSLFAAALAISGCGKSLEEALTGRPNAPMRVVDSTLRIVVFRPARCAACEALAVTLADVHRRLGPRVEVQDFPEGREPTAEWIAALKRRAGADAVATKSPDRPYAFVVDADNSILWHGDPTDSSDRLTAERIRLFVSDYDGRHAHW